MKRVLIMFSFFLIAASAFAFDPSPGRPRIDILGDPRVGSEDVGRGFSPPPPWGRANEGRRAEAAPYVSSVGTRHADVTLGLLVSAVVRPQ